MSFYSVINNDKNKLIWSKSIISLAAISEHIKFTVSFDNISLSAINQARTTHAEIIFSKKFFGEYFVDYSDILDEGFDKTPLEDDSPTYSFLVNSKHLALLFKNLDASDLEYICFKIYWNKSVLTKFKYCLLIEIKTKQLIIKKYQTTYQPVARNKLLIGRMYQDALRQQKQSSEDKNDNHIHHIVIEYIILKQFLDMISSAIEDFKIELKREKILFTGYTQQIVKDKEYLKQPMSVTISLSLDELVDSNINMEPGNMAEKCINFRLKDFKNFINLLPILKPSSTSENNDEYLNLETIDNDANVEIFFKGQGSPILYEFKGNPEIVIQYIQISNGTEEVSTNEEEIASSLKRKREEQKLPGHKLYKLAEENHPRIDSEKEKKNQGSKGKKSYLEKISKTKNNMTIMDRHDSNRTELSSEVDGENIQYHRERTPEFSTIARQKPKMLNNDISARRIIIDKEDQTDYSNSDAESSNSFNSDILGPTQINDKPKSIFDN